ncbi:MAG: DUF4835 family protein [Bergeyella sp.]
MKKIFILLLLSFTISFSHAQELLAQVTVNASQVQGSNVQMINALQKSLRDFINNTSWTGKKLQNFEKIKCNFSIIISERSGNSYKSSIVVQSTRPVFNTTYDSPVFNFQDANFPFEYAENENLIFNERQFSGKNLIDVVSFYVYMILGYDADSFKIRGGQAWFDKAYKISQNSQNQNFGGWSVMDGIRSRGSLIDNLIKPEQNTLRNVFYNYHRSGLDNMHKTDPSQAKRAIADALLQLKTYENNFAMNAPLSVFLDAKKSEIYEIFSMGNNAGVDIQELKSMMILFVPKDTDSSWNKWK